MTVHIGYRFLFTRLTGLLFLLGSVSSALEAILFE